ncbi:MmpS family transport accessory protein [Streptomyces monticola]|uniref:MmpS family transport accessory protein n=1 Tax=Streptomyces monticola TaxID=2666263 RepID=A0ABW2JMM6_9ACTN
MNRTFRTAVCAFAAAGLAFGLTACSEAQKVADGAVDKAVNEKYDVTYEVTGNGVDEIQFNGGGGKSATDPKIEKITKPELPWKKTVTLRGIEPPTVLPIAADIKGTDVTCKITYKGKVIKEASGEGVISGGGCVAVSPIVEQ